MADILYTPTHPHIRAHAHIYRPKRVNIHTYTLAMNKGPYSQTHTYKSASRPMRRVNTIEVDCCAPIRIAPKRVALPEVISIYGRFVGAIDGPPPAGVPSL